MVAPITFSFRISDKNEQTLKVQPRLQTNVGRGISPPVTRLLYTNLSARQVTTGKPEQDEIAVKTDRWGILAANFVPTAMLNQFPGGGIVKATMIMASEPTSATGVTFQYTFEGRSLKELEERDEQGKKTYKYYYDITLIQEASGNKDMDMLLALGKTPATTNIWAVPTKLLEEYPNGSVVKITLELDTSVPVGT